MHYAQAAEVAKSGAIPGSSSAYAPVDQHTSNGSPSTSYAGESTHQQASPSDFRSRFQRPLVAPSPFRTFTVDTQATTPTSTSTMSNASGKSDGIDPHLPESRHASKLVQAR